MNYKLFLLAVFLAVWSWAAWAPLYSDDWLLENYLVFISVPIILITARWFRLSNISYTLITLFMCLHVIGSHYTYAEVPFGFTLQEWLGTSRNMYDRLVHFSYGLLIAYPMREVFLRIVKMKGFWGYFFPVDITLSFSALYEIIEWRSAAHLPADLGLSFLGSQGDAWDAQKDMTLAGIGAVIAMIIVFLVRLRYDKDLWREIKSSFAKKKNDAPLGEEWIAQKIKEEKNEASAS
jgi:putative membrane protein